MKIPYAGSVFDHEEVDNLIVAAHEFWLTEGHFAEEFSRALCGYLGMKYCVLTNSGSSANLLAFSCLELPKGSEVITTACAFPTTVNPVIQTGCVPVFIDIEIPQYTMDARFLEQAITKKTRAIQVLHTLGNPCQMDQIMRIAAKFNLLVVEDNCDSLGSRFMGKLTGTFGDLSTLSFYPAHQITTGEGGAVLTNDPELYKRLLSYRDWGRDCCCPTGTDNSCGRRFNQQSGDLPYGYDHKFVYSRIGYNLKMTDLQAAIGKAQMKKLSRFIAIRRRNFASLYRALEKYSDMLILPAERSEPAWFGFPLMVKEGFKRSTIIEYLESKGVQTRMPFAGNLLKQPAYMRIKSRVIGNLSKTDTAMNKMFWVGVYPGIDREKMEYLIDQFKNFFEGKVSAPNTLLSLPNSIP